MKNIYQKGWDRINEMAQKRAKESSVKKMNYSIKLLTIIFLLLNTLTFTGCVGYGGPRGESRIIIYDKTYDILVKNNYCQDIRSCPRQGIISSTPTIDGDLIVSIYGITDRRVLNSIKNIAYEEYKKNNGSFGIHFIAQKETMKERQEMGLVHSIQYKIFNKSLMEINFKRRLK